MTSAPKVSVGLPVFNGSDYLTEALDSLLDQTFGDFELLIQDNASTDNTEKICRTYMHKDARIKYVRNSENLGAARNFNLTVERARAEYFKWAAHDDICAATFLTRCINVLDSDPSVILCAGQTALINDDGTPVRYDSDKSCFVTNDGRQVGRIDRVHRAEGPSAAGRYWDILVRTMRSFEIFGVMRTSVLRETNLIENYYGSDKVLLAELSLRGRFRQVSEQLLYRRCHDNQSSRLSAVSKGTWIGYKPETAMVTRVRNLIPSYIRTINRAPISVAEKLLCYGVLAYRLIAPTTWHKQVNIGRYTDTVTS